MSEFKTKWAESRLKVRAEREQRQFARAMASPVARAELASVQEMQLNHIASLALAMESLEELLVAKGILEADQLMAHMEVVAKRKMEQVEAAAATRENAQELLAQFKENADGR